MPLKTHSVLRFLYKYAIIPSIAKIGALSRGGEGNRLRKEVKTYWIEYPYDVF